MDAYVIFLAFEDRVVLMDGICFYDCGCTR